MLNHFPSHKFEAVPTCCPKGVVFPPCNLLIIGDICIYHAQSYQKNSINIVAFKGFSYFISSCHGHCKGNHQHGGQVHGYSIVTGKIKPFSSQQSSKTNEQNATFGHFPSPGEIDRYVVMWFFCMYASA